MPVMCSKEREGLGDGGLGLEKDWTYELGEAAEKEVLGIGEVAVEEG